MVNNITNVTNNKNKTNNQLSPQIIVYLTKRRRHDVENPISGFGQAELSPLDPPMHADVLNKENYSCPITINIEMIPLLTMF
jgi:hypothetical protein